MKPLRAFPFPLNIGTDICQISRIYGILAGPRRARFVERILAPEEQVTRRGLKARGPSIKVETLHDDRSTVEKIQEDDHRGIAQRDPDGWKTAAFIAGRYIYTTYTVEQLRSLVLIAIAFMFAAK